MQELFKYIRIWWMMTQKISQIAFASRVGLVLFTAGKILRFTFFLVFLLLLVGRTQKIGSYSLWQMVFFFITFNIVDVVSQFFLREVYRFRDHVLKGNFDYMLTKPFSPLFRALFGGSDVLDLITILPLIGFMFYVLDKLGPLEPLRIVLYLFLLTNAFLITVSFHIAVLGLGVITTEVDNAIWIFRDLIQLGRIPIDIYREPVSFMLTFVVPVAIMTTIPAKALFGLLSWQTVFVSVVISITLLILSLTFWRISLRFYTSASS